METLLTKLDEINVIPVEQSQGCNFRIYHRHAYFPPELRRLHFNKLNEALAVFKVLISITNRATFFVQMRNDRTQLINKSGISSKKWKRWITIAETCGNQEIAIREDSLFGGIINTRELIDEAKAVNGTFVEEDKDKIESLPLTGEAIHNKFFGSSADMIEAQETIHGGAYPPVNEEEDDDEPHSKGPTSVKSVLNTYDNMMGQALHGKHSPKYIRRSEFVKRPVMSEEARKHLDCIAKHPHPDNSYTIMPDVDMPPRVVEQEGATTGDVNVSWKSINLESLDKMSKAMIEMKETTDKVRDNTSFFTNLHKKMKKKQ